MPDEDRHEIVPEDTDTGDGSGIPETEGSPALRKIQRAVSEEALANPEAMRFLVNENDRLEIENIELKNYQKMFYEADKKVAVLEKDLEEKRKAKICLTVGAVMIGYATNLLESQRSDWLVWITLILGGVLILLGGIFEKVVKR